ncbi:hypothetical protein ACIGW8_37255 [Streptomyces sioyaensis]|uniref:hypothetical protein n=1 Tax=Streptomyces sioyaensis TaxID=67364 RepID=UPI0037D1ECCF
MAEARVGVAEVGGTARSDDGLARTRTAVDDESAAVSRPVHVADLAQAILELAAGDPAGVRHLAGSDAVSRHELGVLMADRDALDASRPTAGCRAGTGSPGALDVRLESSRTQRSLRTTLRGAREFLRRER